MHMHMGLIPLRVSGIWASMNMLVHMRRSECEWHFVADPMSGLTTLGLSSYPEEGRSIDSASAGTEPEARLSWNQIGGLQSHVIVGRRLDPQRIPNVAGDSHRRAAKPPEEFAAEIGEVNTRLAAVGTAALLLEEFMGARMYTGPCL
jgi:hypothetical protein